MAEILAPWTLPCPWCSYRIEVFARGMRGRDQGAGVEAAETMKRHIKKHCKACRAAYRRERYAADPAVRAKAREAARKRIVKLRADPEAWERHRRQRKNAYNRKLRTPERRERERIANRKSCAGKYGLTIEEYDAILAKGCAICGARPPDRKLHLDHDHQNGKIRAALCAQHNLGLGAFADDVKQLRAAADYIEEWRESRG